MLKFVKTFVMKLLDFLCKFQKNTQENIDFK